MIIDTHSLVIWLIVGLVSGFLAAKVMTGHGFGILVDILVGIIGAVLGTFVAGALGFAATGIVSEILVAFVGAVILLALLRLVGVGRRRRRLS